LGSIEGRDEVATEISAIEAAIVAGEKPGCEVFARESSTQAKATIVADEKPRCKVFA
jgi:hypothetical protein